MDERREDFKENGVTVSNPGCLLPQKCQNIRVVKVGERLNVFASQKMAFLSALP